MLILMAPGFTGTDRDYAELSRLTGLLVYDLKTRVRTGLWSVLRPLADAAQALELTSSLQAADFPVVAVETAVAHDPARPIIAIEALVLGDATMTLHVPGQTMTVENAAVLTLIRGEIQPAVAVTSSSSVTLRAVVPTAAERQAFRDASSAGFDVHAALDIHFASVLWVGRIDARRFEFSMLADPGPTPAAQLDQLAELLAARSGARLDRGSRLSSVASFAARPPPLRSISPSPGSVQASRAAPSDPRFDAYSRVVAEAERLLRGAGAG